MHLGFPPEHLLRTRQETGRDFILRRHIHRHGARRRRRRRRSAVLQGCRRSIHRTRLDDPGPSTRKTHRPRRRRARRRQREHSGRGVSGWQRRRRAGWGLRQRRAARPLAVPRMVARQPTAQTQGLVGALARNMLWISTVIALTEEQRRDLGIGGGRAQARAGCAVGSASKPSLGGARWSGAQRRAGRSRARRRAPLTTVELPLPLHRSTQHRAGGGQQGPQRRANHQGAHRRPGGRGLHRGPGGRRSGELNLRRRPHRMRGEQDGRWPSGPGGHRRESWTGGLSRWPPGPEWPPARGGGV